MINKIWIFLILFSLGFSMITGSEKTINNIILETPLNAFNLFIQIFVMLIFWNGILEIAKEGGFLKFITKILKKIITPLFKDLPKDSLAIEYICGNVAANMLGLGSAATPMGLKAMEELKKISGVDVASKEMITLLILNTSGLTLIPTGLIALRKSYQATKTVEIIPFVILASVLTTIMALLVDYAFRREK